MLSPWIQEWMGDVKMILEVEVTTLVLWQVLGVIPGGESYRKSSLSHARLAG
jgi:hypothetical protein